MGNSLSESERNDREKIINSICKMDFYKLDIGDKIGSTGYLDFIKQSDLPNKVNIATGTDYYGRKFFVFKARFYFENNEYFDTFSTFFQRYDDNNLLWHCCGHYGIYLLNTEGGTNNSQFKFIQELFENKKVLLNKELCLKTKLNFKKSFTFGEELKDTDYPIRVELF